MKIRRIIGFILTLSLIISCALALTTINGSAMQVSGTAPTTPTVGVASILSGSARVYCNSSGYLDTVYVNSSNVRFNFVSSAADLTKTMVWLYKENDFKSFIYDGQSSPVVSVVNSNGVSCNSINLPGAGRYQMLVVALDSNNSTVSNQYINIIYMDYSTDNYFVNEAWNNWWVFENNNGGELNVHAKIHDIGLIGIYKSDVKIRFYKQDNPNNYVVCPGANYQVTPYMDDNHYDTDYDYYLHGVVNGSSFGNTPGVYVAEVYLFDIPWRKTFATIN